MSLSGIFPGWFDPWRRLSIFEQIGEIIVQVRIKETNKVWLYESKSLTILTMYEGMGYVSSKKEMEECQTQANITTPIFTVSTISSQHLVRLLSIISPHLLCSLTSGSTLWGIPTLCLLQVWALMSRLAILKLNARYDMITFVFIRQRWTQVKSSNTKLFLILVEETLSIQTKGKLTWATQGYHMLLKDTFESSSFCTNRTAEKQNKCSALSQFRTCVMLTSTCVQNSSVMLS